MKGQHHIDTSTAATSPRAVDLGEHFAVFSLSLKMIDKVPTGEWHRGGERLTIPVRAKNLWDDAQR